MIPSTTIKRTMIELITTSSSAPMYIPITLPQRNLKKRTVSYSLSPDALILQFRKLPRFPSNGITGPFFKINVAIVFLSSRVATVHISLSSFSSWVVGQAFFGRPVLFFLHLSSMEEKQLPPTLSSSCEKFVPW